MSKLVTTFMQNPDITKCLEWEGHILARCGMFDCGREETGVGIALACFERDIDPIAFAETYHLVNGKPTIRADTALAQFRKAGGKLEWKQFDGAAAIGVFDFEGRKTSVTFTIDEAKASGWVRSGSTWTKDPGAMLRARCVTRALRMLCPEVLKGMSTTEEALDVSGGMPENNLSLMPTAAQAAVPENNAQAAVKWANERKVTPKPEEAPAPKRDAGKPSTDAVQSAVQPVSQSSTVQNPSEAVATASPQPVTGAASQSTQGTAQTPNGTPFRAESGAGGKLTAATIAAIESACGEGNSVNAFAYLTAKLNWLKKGESFADLSKERAQMILDKAESFRVNTAAYIASLKK